MTAGGERERLRDRPVPVSPEADAVPRASKLPTDVEARGVHVLQERPHGGADGVVSRRLESPSRFFLQQVLWRFRRQSNGSIWTFSREKKKGDLAAGIHTCPPEFDAY